MIKVTKDITNYKVLPDTTLFTFWDLAKKNRCPWCFNKLKNLKTGWSICQGAKHKQKTFVIETKKLVKMMV